MTFLSKLVDRKNNMDRYDELKQVDSKFAEDHAQESTYDPDVRSMPLSKISYGCWYTIHLSAARGKSEVLKGIIELYREAFSCIKCRGHINEYCENNPLPVFDNNVPNIRKRIVLFDWTFRFHNAVSKRIGKKEMDYQTSRNIFMELTDIADSDAEEYISTGICRGSCGDVDKVPESTKENRNYVFNSDVIGSINFITRH